ncbi:MAG: hypothetical protein AAF490_27820 [Chloroflexota bacterium]
MYHKWPLLWIGILCLMVGCSSGLDRNGRGHPIIENHPCEAPDDGARFGYHAPGNDAWLLECNPQLNREYWRVFVTLETEKAYIIPRPDGAPELASVCQDLSEPLHSIATANFLCQPASSSQQVEAINSLEPNEALQIARYLHSRLQFVYDPNIPAILPFPIPSDILDACSIRGFQNEVELEALCQTEERRASSGQEIGIVYSGPGAEQLVRRLNELYGIENDGN